MSPPCPLQSFLLPSHRTWAWPGPALSSSTISYTYLFAGSFETEPYDTIQAILKPPSPKQRGPQVHILWLGWPLVTCHLWPQVELAFSFLEDPEANEVAQPSKTLQVSQTTSLVEGEKLFLKVVLWPPHTSHGMHAFPTPPPRRNKVIKILEKILNLFIFLKNIYCTKK